MTLDHFKTGPDEEKKPFPELFLRALRLKEGRMVSMDFLVGLGINFTECSPESLGQMREVFVKVVSDEHADFEVEVEKNQQNLAIHSFRFVFAAKVLCHQGTDVQNTTMSFEEVLEELQIDEEELKGMISKAELRAFKSEEGMSFKTKDIRSLKNERSRGPTIILTESDQEMGRDELILEDSTSDTIINIGDIVGGRGGSSRQEIIFDTTEEYTGRSGHEDFSRTESDEERKARIENLIDIMPDQGLVSRDTMLDLFTNRVLPAHITCGIVINGQLFAGAMEMDTSAPVYVYDPEIGDLMMLPAEKKQRTRSPNSLLISAMTLVVGMGIGAVLNQKIPFLKNGTPTASRSQADEQRLQAEYDAILQRAHGFLNPQGLKVEQCDASIRAWQENAQHPERAKNLAQWGQMRAFIELDETLRKKIDQLRAGGNVDGALLREMDSMLNPNRVTEADVQRALAQWEKPELAQNPDREETVRQWRVWAELLELQKKIHEFSSHLSPRQ